MDTHIKNHVRRYYRLLLLIMLFASPTTQAHTLQTATATIDCTGNEISINFFADRISLNDAWLIEYSLSVESDTGGPPVERSRSLSGPSPDELTPGIAWRFFWEDLNGNGIKDSTEPGIDGVPIELFQDDCSTSTVLMAVTAGGGIYGIEDITPGTYCVRFDLPDICTLVIGG